MPYWMWLWYEHTVVPHVVCYIRHNQLSGILVVFKKKKEEITERPLYIAEENDMSHIV